MGSDAVVRVGYDHTGCGIAVQQNGWLMAWRFGRFRIYWGMSGCIRRSGIRMWIRKWLRVRLLYWDRPCCRYHWCSRRFSRRLTGRVLYGARIARSRLGAWRLCVGIVEWMLGVWADEGFIDYVRGPDGLKPRSPSDSRGVLL